MPTNYNKIREDNRRKYGEETGHLSILEQLYTDRTHFIFELFQNAEDAGANQILFNLFDDRLEVAHDGRPFDERDVRGVCGVGKGTKTEDLTQIGRFGIGFKSVYAYTETPEIHSNGEGFRIEHYVRPYAVPFKPPGNFWTTLFVFRFNKKDKVSPETACKEIGVRLRSLSARTLLFLRKVKEIEYKLLSSTSEQLTSGTYLRDEDKNSQESCKKVSVISEITDENNGKHEDEENWLIFERSVPVPGDSGTVSIEISFQLESQDKTGKNHERIVKIQDSPLFVYFPTEKETRFGFLIQGPYRTTPSRDNIPKDDEWNKKLVEETAELIKDILSAIKNLGLLSVSFLEALPIRIEDFPDNSMFYPIVESVRDTLIKEELLPANDGSFVSAENAKLARGAGLRKLLNQIQLSRLFESTDTMKWLAEEITQDRTPDLRSYLINTLNVEEVTPEVFSREISHSFLSDQPEEWFVGFYRYLSGQEALWRVPFGILRSKKPILRLANGSQEVPFKSDGRTPKAFLPPPEETTFPVVSRSIVTDEQARTFLKRLGLSEPNVFDDIVERVLPKYANIGGDSVSGTEHHEDIKKIVRAMGSDSEVGKKRVIEKAKQTPFLKSINPSGDTVFKKPSEIYLKTIELQRYFSGVQEVWFLHDEYNSLNIDIDGFWYDLGVLDLPRKLPTTEGFPVHREKSTKKEVIENYDLDGLEQFLKVIQETTDIKEQEKSASVLWNFLRDYLNRDARFFKAQYRWFYRKLRNKSFSSRILDRLKNTKWIPTKDGSLERPDKITTDQLIEEFLGATELIKSLGIGEGADQSKDAQKRELATKLDVSLEDIELVKNLKNHPGVLEQVKANLAARPSFPTSPVANPEQRQERLVEQLTDAPDKEYEKRERSVRTTNRTIDPITWLRNQYMNEDDQMVCQICREEMPFRKRNGDHYFEKKEVLSRDDLPKENEAQYLALCPLCAAKYDEFIKTDDEAMAELRQNIVSSEDYEISISLGDEKTSIRFVETHYHDLKTIIKGVK